MVKAFETINRDGGKELFTYYDGILRRIRVHLVW